MTHAPFTNFYWHTQEDTMPKQVDHKGQVVDTPPASVDHETRITIRGRDLTVRELREFLSPLPNDATLYITTYQEGKDVVEIRARWGTK